MKNKKYIFGALAIVAIFVANISGAVTVLLPQNPNTGTILVGSSTTAYRNFATGTPGYVLTATSSSPYLTWAAGATGGGGSIGTSSAVTAGYFPYWGTASALTGTSTIFQLGALVGIGTTTPSQALHVIGNGLFSGTLSASGYNSTNWDTAYTDRLKWDGGSTGLTAATGRTSLGLGALATADTVPYASTTGVQATISAGSNIVLTGASVAVTSTPSFTSVTIPSLTNTILGTDANGNIIATTTTASATVAGSDTQVQFNNGGSLGASSGLTYTTSTKRLAINSSATSSVLIGNSFPAIESVSFAYTGATSSWTVPQGVTSVAITAVGGAGGGVSATGKGGTAVGTLAVTPGQILYYAVGGAGATKTTNLSSQAGAYPGGGSGIAGSNNASAAYGGGGGMTWVSTSPSFSSTTVLIVGAGGGGSSGAGAGANGGGLTGSASSGGGGTQTAGGAAGGIGATAGSEGQGGNAGYQFSTAGGAGGGGAGYYGGGGGFAADGGGYGSGGGGSSYMKSVLTTTSTTAGTNSGAGTLTFTYQPKSIDFYDLYPYSLAVGGHIITGGTSAPTISSCGTNPSVIGNDTSGRISVGTGGTSACTITFNQGFYYVPSCTATVASSSAAYAYITSALATSTTFGLSSSMQSGTKINYQCLGY